MIYICIPTHNEQQTVGVVLWKLRQVLTDFPRDYQLLVADDASSDKTPEVLEPYTRVLPLTVIRSDTRQGYAASLEMLLREAVRRSEYPKRDVIVVLQADFSDEPDDLVGLVKRLEAGADVAVGNKVSTARETRGRRLSRALGRFFLRRQKWPEGVESPFDGYRAYRLYAVKRAMEERAGRRLIRFDGWAGHAELLRAVLPHARRIDVVDVDDRPDRLQRPRREKPLASALQVRVLAGGAEPGRLVGVEELDRIAATASRSRERAGLVVQPTQNGRSRTNGSQGRSARGPGRPRSAGSEPQRRKERGERTGGERQPRQRSGETRAGTAGPRRERPSAERPRRERRSGAPRQEAERVEAAAAGEEPQLPPGAEPVETPAGAEAAAADGSEARTKRRRRRRRRGKPAGEAAAAQESGADEGADAGPDGAGEAAGDSDEDSPDGSPKKRRRRGGRRGGRGRRRTKAEGSDDAAAGAPAVTPAADAVSVEPQGVAPKAD